MNLKELLEAWSDNQVLSQGTDLENTFSVIQFIGFNPNNFYINLRKIEPNDSIFTKDLKQLLVISANRGTKWDKAIKKMHPDGVKIVNSLVSKYKIKTNVPSNDKDVTFGRISATFPNLVSDLIVKGYGRVVGESGDCPKALCHTAGASLIPKSDIKLFKSWCSWRESFAKVIKSKSSNEYDEIVWNSDLFTESDRQKIIKKYT